MTDTLTPDQLVAKLRALESDTVPEMRKAMTQCAQIVEAQAKDNCTPGKTPYRKAPYDTGTLRGSIKGVVRVAAKTVTGFISADTDYAEAVHEGTTRESSLGGRIDVMYARPFLLDAVKVKESEVLERMSKAIESMIRRHTT